MNEQIRKLRNEAENWVADNFSTDELDPYEWWEKSEQKFAELIIRECAKVVFDKTGPKSALNVLEHFGVEE